MMLNISLFIIFLNKIYSTIDSHEDMIAESGNYWISINNICLCKYDEYRMSFILLFVQDVSEYNILGNFPIFFNFGYFHHPLNPSFDYKDEEIWLTSSWLNYNIAHFLDNMFLYNIQNDNKYPKINHLIMADFNPQSTIPYNNMMLKMMINNYNKPFKMTFQSEISRLLRKSSNHLLCYKRVHIYIRSENGGFLGIFRNYEKGRKYRDEGYKYLKIKVEKDKENENLITIISRKAKGRTRSITNLEMIKEMIKSLGYKYKEIYFEDKNPKEQIESIMKSKIIIKNYGSGIVNILWIISSKCIIIECISTFFTFAYYTYSLNYKYMSLYSLFHDLNPYTFDEGYDEKYKFEHIPTVILSVYYASFCPLSKYHSANMTISLKQIEFSLKYGLNYLNRLF